MSLKAAERRRRCCLFAEQLPLTETLILPSLHPPPPPKKPLKETALCDGGREKKKKASIFFITAQTASSDRNIHPSILLQTAERKAKHPSARWRFPRAGI